ncbi:CBS domain-containing protein [Natronococcus occultus]|uniref:CBS domain-containing protein n=1 Tax=Natronococcus occultus TaxID=29288 RepID=UPI002683ADE1
MSLASESQLGETLHAFREYRVTYLPVVEDGVAVGILSLYSFVRTVTSNVTVMLSGSTVRRARSPMSGRISTSP